MTALEKQIWAATYATAYVAEMDVGRRQGHNPTPDRCNGFSRSAIDIADSAVFAIRHTYDESDLVLPPDVNQPRDPDEV